MALPGFRRNTINYNCKFSFRVHVKVSDGEAFVRHIRASCYTHDCRGEWKHGPLNDTWLSDWSRRIETNVQHVRKAVFDTEQMI